MAGHDDRRKDRKDGESSEFLDRLVAINRTAKVVKGGRRFGFTALVVVGDGKGRVGFGKGKANEVGDAKKKASQAAKKAMIRVPLREGRTVHHDVRASSGAGHVVIRSAPPGTGVIAGGAMRAIFEALGVQDVVAKSTGSSNSFNMVHATFEALKDISSPKLVAARRGRKVSDIIAQRDLSLEGKEHKDEDVAAEDEVKISRRRGGNAVRMAGVEMKDPATEGEGA